MTALVASGCATMAGHQGAAKDSTKNSDSASLRVPKTMNEVLSQNSHSAAPEEAGPDVSSAWKSNHLTPQQLSEIEIQGVKLKNTKFDIPITINSRVEYWVDYFTHRGRPFFAKYLERSEFFIPYIKPLLKQNGMPEDLVYLSMIESGFNNLARSHARAVGPWQFMSATGKRYGLAVNWWVDERRDIKKSTLAAVEYLRDLYNMFGSWELAAASYNAGEAKVARAVQRYGTRDFWVIAKHRFLRPETRDYVPKMIAAALIAKNRGQFGFQVGQTELPADETVAPDGEIVKVIKSDHPEADMHPQAVDDSNDADFDDQEDNDPRGPTITPATLTLPVDNGAVEGQLASGKVQDAQPLAKPAPTPHVGKNGQVGGDQLTEFDVQSPADLLKVARAAGLSYTTVKSLNPELLRWCTPPNTGSYRLKLPASTKEKFLATYNHAAYPRKVTFAGYKVRSGETISLIARRYGIKVDPLTDLNGISARSPLRKGIRVLLPLPDDRSRSLASLDVRDPPEKASRHRRRSRPKSAYKITYKRRESAKSHRQLASDT